MQIDLRLVAGAAGTVGLGLLGWLFSTVNDLQIQQAQTWAWIEALKAGLK